MNEAEFDRVKKSKIASGYTTWSIVFDGYRYHDHRYHVTDSTATDAKAKVHD